MHSSPQDLYRNFDWRYQKALPTPTIPVPINPPGSASPDVLPGFPIYSLGGDLHIFLRGGKYIFSFQLIVMTLTNISYSIVTIEKVKSYMTFFFQLGITETIQPIIYFLLYCRVKIEYFSISSKFWFCYIQKYFFELQTYQEILLSKNFSMIHLTYIQH